MLDEKIVQKVAPRTIKHPFDWRQLWDKLHYAITGPKFLPFSEWKRGVIRLNQEKY